MPSNINRTALHTFDTAARAGYDGRVRRDAAAPEPN
jgi:hypothetical protein